MAVSETSLVKKNHQITIIVKQKIAQKLIEKVPMTAIARKLFPSAKIALDHFHIVQHLSRAMSRVRVQIMKQFERKSHEYRALKRYWKLIQQDSRKLSDKRFYRPTFRMHLTNQEILEKLLSYSQELREHYELD